VRLIAATNRNLLEGARNKTFREDLYYRLNVIHIPMPPLRERREDILVLIEHFLGAYAKQHRFSQPRLLEETMARLMAYDWPGNVRELKNVAESLVVRRKSDVIGVADLPREIAGKWSGPVPDRAPQTSRLTPDVLLERMSVGGESFWSVVYEPFISRDLTRDDLRTIISRGLERTRGSYKALVQTFNLEAQDYKRFLSFLRKYECHMPFQRFRAVPVRLDERVDEQLRA
jgi:DNA-binding NtrC family response regulator